MLHFYRRPALTSAKINELLSIMRAEGIEIDGIETEYCFNIETTETLLPSEVDDLRWLLSETFEPYNFSVLSFLASRNLPPTSKYQLILEVGPRMNFTTAWSANAVSICHASGLKKISRIERSRLFLLKSEWALTEEQVVFFVSKIHDRMTECLYPEPLTTFETGIQPKPVFTVPLMEEGKTALKKLNREMGLGLDDWDINYYRDLFVKDIGRNPTDVEMFDLSQSNSEHSRHWFFKGKLVVDGVEAPHDLMELIRGPLNEAVKRDTNSVIAFNDNSSSIRGYEVEIITPENPGWPSPFKRSVKNYDIIFTAETHNFPSGVAPFPGAETGTGGRIRDVQATGRGGLVVAGTAGYCVGSLRIPGYDLPWEDKSFIYPTNLATPLEIEIQASNGASDYGNKFGEPVIQGYTRSFEMRVPNGDRYGYVKPIMFTGGVGQMDAMHVEKGEPEEGMLVVKIGGPAYRIGIGGGAASSMIQGENAAELDFNAVQRGDGEMEQKVNRVIRACVEMGDKNPIITIHDQGAGGNCNVVKEIIYPAGAKIEVRKIQLGDDTLSVLEIWGAEYQEQNALLLKPDDYEMFEKMCKREKVPCAAIGRITGDGYIVLFDENDNSTPENLDLSKVLGDMPQKTFHLDRIPMKNEPLKLPEGLTVRAALDRVLRLLSVGSKRFLTNKVDRSVTGLIVQQQCVGPLQLPLSDVAVIAQSHFGLTGAAISIGECAPYTLINPAAMARMAVGETLTNFVWAKVSALEDIECSGNWMWAAKLPGEGAKLYDAAVALSDILIKLGIAIDGGKDSLSMAAVVGKEKVKAPGTLVMSGYCTVPDITKVITPDLKQAGNRLYYIDLALGERRLGGSALAHVYNQIGDECPDVVDVELLKAGFNAIQEMVEKELILSGHDISDGGLITTLLEMSFAGNLGIHVDMAGFKDAIHDLFAEELGVVVEVPIVGEEDFMEVIEKYNLPWRFVGSVRDDKRVIITHENTPGIINTVIEEDMRVLRQIWEETSYQLERLQSNPKTAEEEKDNIFNRRGAQYHLTFEPEDTAPAILSAKVKPKVAIIREEGSNSDREMTSAFYQAGFEPWDITMTDFLEDRITTLKDFRGLAFVGGFSYADVLDSAKGWAGVIRFNKKLWDMFEEFYNRLDTFSLGVCNGCQLMALLGWVPFKGLSGKEQPRFIRNTSGRFESRFSSVTIQDSPSIMLKGMEGSTLGIWVAHGEGRAYFPDINVLDEVEYDKLAPIRYVDDEREITMGYPFNPNGSTNAIAGLCSKDGRHLAIMPHPERTFLKWQWPWMPEDWKKELKASPWLKMFQNAREWCKNK